jgi:hypothetical protein
LVSKLYTLVSKHCSKPISKPQNLTARGKKTALIEISAQLGQACPLTESGSA